MKTEYEWDIETVNTETGDIEDHTHFNTALQAAKWIQRSGDWLEPNQVFRLVLVRSEWDFGLNDRFWCYPLPGGVLPDCFSDSYSDKPRMGVPAPQRRQFAALMRSNLWPVFEAGAVFVEPETVTP